MAAAAAVATLSSIYCFNWGKSFQFLSTRPPVCVIFLNFLIFKISNSHRIHLICGLVGQFFYFFFSFYSWHKFCSCVWAEWLCSTHSRMHMKMKWKSKIDMKIRLKGTKTIHWQVDLVAHLMLFSWIFHVSGLFDLCTINWRYRLKRLTGICNQSMFRIYIMAPKYTIWVIFDSIVSESLSNFLIFDPNISC